MLSLVRGGPKVLMLETTRSGEDLAELEAFLAALCPSSSADPMGAVETASEEATLVIFMASGEEPAMRVYSTHLPPEDLLCQLINRRLCEKVDNLCPSPGTAVMRLVGTPEGLNLAMERIASDLNGTVGERPHNFVCPAGSRTVIYFTQNPLNRPLRMEDLSPRAVLVDRPCGEVLSHLRENAMDYLSLAMGGPDWNQVDIRIYDAEGRYDLHYRRLMGAIEGIDAGLVLSEAWGRDQAFILMSVPVYVVRLFTPLDPSEIKRMCMGLEYSPKGERWVDLDVICSGKKVSWTGLEHPGTRDSLGEAMRRELLGRMNQGGLKRLLEAEGELMGG
ncbi:hypothetical protein Taci_0327 [Thermanaerovibrio acidaminovorans DSM 6589]|uniref:Uncharacterized protein n=1 Tax=Thermanaerovibrio acidaminovorans (strain ATCC 49978 / DSM 6589 / Su883) TaxID=525903 RepID=D1B8G1_THEAS|nr:hypothetical protein [Thermanaerovibrio acidaminovorans]ACZ18564.1 hypothetical protein Taci_0327 [Thermanaerovibrio acidaminovorans DSM 6589]